MQQNSIENYLPLEKAARLIIAEAPPEGYTAKEMVSVLIKRGLIPPMSPYGGKTREQTLAAAIYRSIDRGEPIYRKVSLGRFGPAQSSGTSSNSHSIAGRSNLQPVSYQIRREIIQVEGYTFVCGVCEREFKDFKIDSLNQIAEQHMNSHQIRGR